MNLYDRHEYIGKSVPFSLHLWTLGGVHIQIRTSINHLISYFSCARYLKICRGARSYKLIGQDKLLNQSLKNKEYRVFKQRYKHGSNSDNLISQISDQVQLTVKGPSNRTLFRYRKIDSSNRGSIPFDEPFTVNLTCKLV